MKDKLPKNIMRLFRVVAATADELAMSAYVVGGFVRDLLIGIKNFDLDIVVEGDGILFAETLGEKLAGRVRSHAKFCTSVIVLPDGPKIDVATARMELYKHPAALPTVRKSLIKPDLSRRDFSINSLALKLNGPDAFCLIDFFDGQRDLKDKVVRTLHELSFIDDPCRVFRAVRFEQRFQFIIEKQTEVFLRNAVKKRFIDRLSGQRLLNELISMLKERKPLRCIRRMQELGLLQFIHVDLLQSKSGWEILEKIEEVLIKSKVIPLDYKPEPWFVYFLGLFYPLETVSVEEAADRLKMPAKMRTRVEKDLEGCHKAFKVLGKSGNPRPGEIYDVFCELSPESVVLLLAIADSDRMNWYALVYFAQYRNSTMLDLTGEDLVKMGLKPGPVFQDVFAALREARLNGSVKTREDEASFVKERFLPSR